MLRFSLQEDAFPQAYLVLATVSGSYPSLRGRLPTCYSPVRRYLHPKVKTARLACIRHAASVRPEPGSNSPKLSPEGNGIISNDLLIL